MISLSNIATATAWRIFTAALFVAVELAARKAENIAHARAGRCELDCVGVRLKLGAFCFGVVQNKIPGVYPGA
jgi:hypothetical protein